MPTRGRRGSKSRIASSAPKAPTPPRVAPPSPIPRRFPHIYLHLPGIAHTNEPQASSLTPASTANPTPALSSCGATTAAPRTARSSSGRMGSRAAAGRRRCARLLTGAPATGARRPHAIAHVQRTWRARTRARLGAWSPALVPHPLITRSHPSPPRGSGVWNGCDAEVGWRVVAILEGMYRSAKEGKRVHVRARKG